MNTKTSNGTANSILAGIVGAAPLYVPFLYQATFLSPTGGFADWLTHHPYMLVFVPFAQQFARDQLNKYFPNALPKAASATITPKDLHGGIS